ncbi:MAG TPA: hypothetical protein VGB76_05465 [Pyrinomonadaceae bacterium]|jgi:hypothetical protein
MPSAYLAFEVYIDNGDNSTTPVASHVVKVYNASLGVALADLATDASGHVSGGTLNVAAGTLIRFSVVLDDFNCGYAEAVTDSGHSMDVILKPSGGANIVLRPTALPTWYPEAEVDPVEVELFKQELDSDNKFVGAPESLGRFPSVGRISIRNNPVTDVLVRFYLIAYAGDDTPDVSSLADALQVTVPVKRETDAPTVTLIGAATNTLIELSVTGYTKFAAKRKLRASPNADMSGATETITDYSGHEMPSVVPLTRPAAAGVETIYVAISHSSGGAFGAESAPQGFTFTDAGGSGGSTGGGGGYWKTDPYDL